MAVRYYDKEGKPLTLEQWGQLMEFPKYRFIASDNVGDMWVSTVWLGLDHNWMGGPPLTFETMIFNVPQGDDRWSSMDMQRYSTLEQAQAGHVEMVEKARAINDGSRNP